MESIERPRPHAGFTKVHESITEEGGGVNYQSVNNSFPPRQRFLELNSVPLQVQLGGFSAELLGWGFISGDWWRNYLHVHSFFEICYAFTGKGEFRICNEVHQIKAGDVFVAKPDEPHEIISSKKEPLEIYFWSYTLQAPKRQTGEMDTLLRAFLESSRRVNADMIPMEWTLELLTDEVVKQEAGYTQVIQGLVTKLLLDTARAVTNVHTPSVQRARFASNAAVDLMTRYLQDNYDRPISIRDVVSQVHLSERHARRLFLEATGKSVKQYLILLRLEVAKQRLLSEKVSVSDIAFAVGFSDVRHFSTTFRQNVGVTPSEFREKGGTTFL
jgi:AraC-like DNA-binding protein/mannose-6-phosphate isomerase-like protein (cupin superfamily)